jgi:hypothetical protein
MRNVRWSGVLLAVGCLGMCPGATPAQAASQVTEAETGGGTGQVMPRSSASGGHTVWLHAGESRVFTITTPETSTYSLALFYSNDNWGAPENVTVSVDGSTLGEFQAEDTGDHGLGWDVMQASPSLGPVALSAGSHEVVATASGGDGYGLELDVLHVAPALVLEAETGTGAGQIMPRSAASGERAVWLHTGETRAFTLTVPTAASYSMAFRYANDSFAGLETVVVSVDGSSVGQFLAQDTGDFGYGWNAPIWSGTVGPVELTPGEHTVTATVHDGDGYGVELDAMQAG